MLMGSNPNTSAPRRTSEWSAELPIKPKPMMATSQLRMAIVFLQRRRSSRDGQATGGAVAGDSGPFRPRCRSGPSGVVSVCPYTVLDGTAAAPYEAGGLVPLEPRKH